jgi:hypothetical protein
MAGLKFAVALAAGATVLCAGPALAQEAASTAAPARTANPWDKGGISGLWISNDFKPVATNQSGGTINPAAPRDMFGEVIPMQPWAAQVFETRLQAARSGKSFVSTKGKCLPAGMPKSMDPPGGLGMQILVTPEQVTILFEEFADYRIIHMGGTHPDDHEPGFFGHSIGHWEGDTLVVDTVGFTTETTIDSIGAPHSDQLHIVERIRRAGPELLEDVMEISDPKAFTRPWKFKSELKRLEWPLEEYFCTNDRNKPNADGTTGFQMKAE